MQKNGMFEPVFFRFFSKKGQGTLKKKKNGLYYRMYSCARAQCAFALD